MSVENATAAAKESPQSVQLFQRAHQKMVMLQRVEDQIQQLVTQRRSIQDELRGIQVQINEEFDKLLRAGGTPAQASRLLADIADESKRLPRDELSVGDDD
ncbi:MAG TPA: hypothetical protein PK402_05565 [Tepidisphaeraceae bacterium]|nr:hypothetical protein [Tepidisphaeraceae bacterium]